MFHKRQVKITTMLFGRASAPSPTAKRLALAPRLFALLMAILLAAFATPNSALADDNYKVVGGLAVYLGVLPAAMVKGHPTGHPEATMHGGVPAGTHEYHLVIAVFDAATGVRVENAEVTASVSGLGHVGESQLKLEPMAIAGTVTYGGFVNLPGTDRYQIGVEIRVPGRNAPVRVDFAYEHSDTQ
jgi:hypothetical protein